MWITGEVAAAIRPRFSSQALITLCCLRLHISDVRLLGRIRVESGELRMTACSMEPMEHAHGSDTSLAGERALSLVGGSAILTSSVLRGWNAGAIGVQTASLVLVECSVRDSTALFGAALLVASGADVKAVRSNFTDNIGGAIQVI